jgi:hypothetical protein
VGCSQSPDESPNASPPENIDQAPASSAEVPSPDGLIALRFAVDGGVPTYAVYYQQGEVVAKSRLGLVLQDMADLVDGFELIATSRDSIESVWTPVWGTRSEILDKYNSLVVALREIEPPHRLLSIDVRTYDDGDVFRYIIPKQSDLKEFVNNGEFTDFNFSPDREAYIGIIREDGRGKSQQVDYPRTTVGEVPPHKRETFLALIHAGPAWVAITEGKDTETVVNVLIKQAHKLPRELYTSLTWDRGKESADHKRFLLATDVDVYFCDPQSPWQRGSNEQLNGLLRQYFPKGMDLSNIHQNKLNAVARQLNGRPRETLDFETPAERFSQCVASIG